MQKAYAIWLTYINSYGEGACSLATVRQAWFSWSVNRSLNNMLDR